MTVLEQIAQRVTEVPLLSPVASQLLMMTGQEDHNVQDLVKIVRTDSALTARVLKVVNSAAFALSQEITSLSLAISYLGENRVVGIALRTYAGHLYQRPLRGYESEEGELWDHSLRTAIAAREMSQFVRSPVSSDLAYTGGLLHDLGKTIISAFLMGSATEITARFDAEEVQDYLEAEREWLGTDHAAVGEALARQWKLPEPLCAVIGGHHRPAEVEATHRVLGYVVHLGDASAMLAGMGTGADTLAYRLDEAYLEYVDISAHELAELLLEVEMKFTRTKESLMELQGVYPPPS